MVWHLPASPASSPTTGSPPELQLHWPFSVPNAVRSLRPQGLCTLCLLGKRFLALTLGALAGGFTRSLIQSNRERSSAMGIALQGLHPRSEGAGLTGQGPTQLLARRDGVGRRRHFERELRVL